MQDRLLRQLGRQQGCVNLPQMHLVYLLTICADNSSNCCTGQHNTTATCPPSGVQYYDYFSASTEMFLIQGIFIELIIFREQLSVLLRLCLRRAQRDRFVDL